MTAGAGAATLFIAAAGQRALAQDVDVKAILHDPEAPEAGNPKGDVTIVNFTDYNCPFCKKAEPDLNRIVKQDGKVRLVYKDWPILSEASVYGAQLALAAKYQGRYDLVHHALMSIPGKRIPKPKMLEAVKNSGVDMNRLNADLKAHSASISALLQRNLDQATALGLQGTPTYLIGPFRTMALDYAGFKEALAEARRRQAAGDRME
ncbi:DsbA family protein [Mesorhizobium sp. 1M-11]|uniref:DsbA family protein n=1 Tax=Mesorhizobium sp. 1M-11 TaxID=1529006 RepID=UPI001FCCF7B4|nr:DsbA family protein [Mesorhizobium sp. 1M-11]